MQEPLTITLNGNLFEIVPGSFRIAPQARAPRLVEGAPGQGEAAEDSVVGWNDWQDGGFEAVWRNPARFATAKDVITDIPNQITLSFLQQTMTYSQTIDGAPIKIAQFRPGDLPVMITPAIVWLKDSGANSWTAKLTGVSPTDIIAWGDGTDTLWLVAMGNATAYRYTTDITASPVSWTTSNLGAGGNAQYADYWAVGPKGSGSNGGTLWKAVKPNLVYASSNPKNGGAWTSAYTVGGSESNITGLAVIEDRLIVAKTDGLYWIQPDGTVQLLVDMSGAVDANNGSAIAGWGGYMFLNWAQGLYQLSGRNLLNVGEITGSFRDVGPNANNQESGDVRGRVTALLGAPTRLYAALTNESGNYSISRYNGDTRAGFGWNPGFLYLGANACSALGWEVPSSGNPRLYFGYGSGVRYVVMPRSGDNPLNDSACSYAASGSLELAEFEGAPFRAMAKAMLYLGVDAERLSSGARYVDVAYKIDDDGDDAWQTLGRYQTSGLNKVYYSTIASGRRIKLQLTLGTTGSTNTPRVRSVEHHYEFRPARRKSWFFQVKAAPTRTNPTRTAKAVRDLLVAAGDADGSVAFEDRYGSPWDAFVEEVNEIETVRIPGSAEPLEVIAVRAREFKTGAGHFTVDALDALVDLAYVS